LVSSESDEDTIKKWRKRMKRRLVIFVKLMSFIGSPVANNASR